MLMVSRALFLAALSFLYSNSSFAKWEATSDFELTLGEKIFDDLLSDFRSRLKGHETIPVPNFTINPGLPITLSGISVDLTYDFNTPARIPGRRAWHLESNSISAVLNVANMSATQIIEKDIGGILVRVKVKADCNNISLELPPGLAHVASTVDASIVQSQLKLSLLDFSSQWPPQSWKLKSIQCSGFEGIQDIVSREGLNALSRFQNLEGVIKSSLDKQFSQWSKDASLLLLSDVQLPSGKDYLQLFYEPNQIVDGANGIAFRGKMKFVYPFVSPLNDISQEFRLNTPSTPSQISSNPQLRVPFETLRFMILGEYFSDHLQVSLKGSEIPAFQSFLGNWFLKLFAWPDLLRFSEKSEFLFQFLPLGAPGFTKEKSGGSNTITGSLALPLAIRSFVNYKGQYTPYVEFKTNVNGLATLRLNSDGYLKIQVATSALKMEYQYAKSYAKKYSPYEYIAINQISESITKAMSGQGVSLDLPQIRVGQNLRLQATGMDLQDNVLKIDFGSSLRAP